MNIDWVACANTLNSLDGAHSNDSWHVTFIKHGQRLGTSGDVDWCVDWCQVNNTTGCYSTCLAGAPNAGPNGLKTSAIFYASDTFLCPNEPVTFSGTLRTRDLSGYEQLADNPLGSRTILIQRASPGGSNFTTYATDTTSSGGSWSTNLSFGAGTNFDYRAKFGDANGLTSDISGTINVRSSSAC